jgi:hypothetical protein
MLKPTLFSLPGGINLVDTSRHRVDGRMFEIDEMWMRSELRWPEAYLMYAVGREAKSAPQIAISNMRPADPDR